MAGSYRHVTDDEGRLLQDEDICSMLECMSGDVAEAVEEMYGMIWYLAERLEGYFAESRYANDGGPAFWVKDAQRHIEEGLEISPGRREEGLPDE